MSLYKTAGTPASEPGGDRGRWGERVVMDRPWQVPAAIALEEF